MRLLLVDDSEFTRRAYREGLSCGGFNLDVASSAQEALARLSREAYDMIVCDVNMPGMNGIDFLNVIRQIDLDLPETTAERDALGTTGCELLQGYLFARPESRPPAVRWD